MPPIPLMRTALTGLYGNANDAHPGLLIQRGLHEYDEDNKEAKTAFIRRVCQTSAGSFYQNAYFRWKAATADPLRFRQCELALASRLFIGLTGGGMLETGSAISHSYGAPYIPGSSIKGVVRAFVATSPFAQAHPAAVADLFGSDADPAGPNPDGLSGLISFHDAWWVPGSAEKPLVEEIVTSHHLDYYGRDGNVWASDCDSPIPNAQIAVGGHFLFVLEGDPAWLDLAEPMLLNGLAEQGVGAKTRSGHGLFDPVCIKSAGPACPWVDQTISKLVEKNRSKPDEVLRGKGLAEAWSQLDDANLKAEALADIRGRWDAEGWWETPPGRAARVKAIYEPAAEG